MRQQPTSTWAAASAAHAAGIYVPGAAAAPIHAKAAPAGSVRKGGPYSPAPDHSTSHR
jgi:hypothetical protein